MFSPVGARQVPTDHSPRRGSGWTPSWSAPREGARAPEGDPQPRTQLFDDRTEPIEEEELVDSRPYVAVVRQMAGVETVEAPDVLRAREARRGTDSYATDIPIAIVSALLAASTFLPWYKGPQGYGLTATGWGSGTWGPLIFFLGVGSVLLVILRRVGVAVSLPIEESLFHEGAGWVALVGAVIKSRFRPGPKDFLSASYGVWIAIGIAAILIVLAGRMSPHAPLVVRPGWHRRSAGIVGIVVLAVVAAGSALFGTVNTASLSPSTNGGDAFAGTIKGKIPACAKSFPLPSGLKPQYGFDTQGACQVQLAAKGSSNDVTGQFRTLFAQKKFTYTEVAGAPGSVVFTITKPRCATLAVVPAESGSIVAVALTPCTLPTASPSP